MKETTSLIIIYNFVLKKQVTRRVKIAMEIKKRTDVERNMYNGNLKNMKIINEGDNNFRKWIKII